MFRAYPMLIRNVLTGKLKRKKDCYRMLKEYLITPAHLYIWDEPLNFIDVFSRMQIEKLILQYNVHIKQDSLAHNLVAKFVKMDGETEDCYAYGDALMYSGVKLKQAFGGTGYNDEVRFYQDFGSRLYFMEENILHSTNF